MNLNEEIIMEALNHEEHEALNAVAETYHKICKLSSGLKYNRQELQQAVHTLQMFVMASILQRLQPHIFSNWFEDGPNTAEHLEPPLATELKSPYDTEENTKKLFLCEHHHFKLKDDNENKSKCTFICTICDGVIDAMQHKWFQTGHGQAFARFRRTNVYDNHGQRIG